MTDLDGNVLVAHRANERFMPASNVKLFVTAAALAAETELSTLDTSLRIELEPTASGPPNLVLIGRGDPTIGFGPDCNVRCLEMLAETIAETGITAVGDIIGDDRWFADERKPLGWSWDDLKFSHGTAISALAVNENVIPLRVAPSSKPGSKITASWIDNGPAY
ncbi:MAG: D-alanyl-D-alanine carboxypeptidase, partial [Pseudomonadota bacterium]